ncbi:Alpha/Beta hydrolase protein [Dactylonectria macrodidyma]|uniref:Alpha/Beta hydrolase protein n=1 Tax=Dactylonectria macrodidyma TaxID=307937 RepID=A0A9P9IQI2_9HYPO|nr:Alpha/Beta hydrolase protein [Dactylonectria macrodidyma]
MSDIRDSQLRRAYTSPLSHPSSRGATPQEYSKRSADGMIIETHVPVPLRTGFHAFADVFRPENESEKAPVLMSWTPYGKHNAAPLYKIYPHSGAKREWYSNYTCFEAPDPIYWTRLGYAVVIVDVPGTWYGEGTPTFSSGLEEAESFYDTIEWFAARPWSSGNVGLNGVSYLAVSQWHVAALNPPSLKCIVPVEGWSDFYREVVRHGGIPDTSFFPYIAERWGAAIGSVEDLMQEFHDHPFWDELWESKKARLERIQVPALVIASFSDQGLHTRGTLEGYKKMASREKWLIVHRRRKWEFYYQPEIVEKQRQFYDKFLKGVADTEVESWPPVKLEVSDRWYQGEWRDEMEWPLSRQVHTPWYLDSKTSAILDIAVEATSHVEYHSLSGGPMATRAVFDKTFTSDVEVTGHISATLFMETSEGDDMDVFVAIYKLDSEDRIMGQTFYAQFSDGPVCLGWLRASRREVDPTLSSPGQPVAAHTREDKLAKNKVYRLEVELWASSMVYRTGEKLRFIVQGTDIARQTNRRDDPKIFTRHESLQVNGGDHRLWTGGEYPSQILVPIIPRKSE